MSERILKLLGINPDDSARSFMQELDRNLLESMDSLLLLVGVCMFSYGKACESLDRLDFLQVRRKLTILESMLNFTEGLYNSEMKKKQAESQSPLDIDLEEMELIEFEVQ